jgi:hypothetical protein
MELAGLGAVLPVGELWKVQRLVTPPTVLIAGQTEAVALWKDQRPQVRLSEQVVSFVLLSVRLAKWVKRLEMIPQRV